MKIVRKCDNNIFNVEAKDFSRDQIYDQAKIQGQTKIWSQATFWAKSEARPILMLGQANEARTGQILCMQHGMLLCGFIKHVHFGLCTNYFRQILSPKTKFIQNEIIFLLQVKFFSIMLTFYLIAYTMIMFKYLALIISLQKLGKINFKSTVQKYTTEAA